jgi:hypothetical protein
MGETHTSNGRPGMVALGLSEAGLRSEMDLRWPGQQVTIHAIDGNLAERLLIISDLRTFGGVAVGQRQ